MSALAIRSVEAMPVSYRLPEGAGPTLGIGRTVKRDAIVVKVTTEDGLVGYGESHHGRAPGTVAHLIAHSLAPMVRGMAASDVVGVWKRIYDMQLASHGLGAATAIAMSGVDMALWDIRAKAVGWPLYKLLGGEAKSVPAYAGGIALGYQAPEALADEASGLVDKGYRALKLRLGDTPRADRERVAAVRTRLGTDVEIMTDANANASLDHVRAILPALDENLVTWLEEPFSPHDHRLYQAAARMGRTALAAGENHYTRFEFHRLIEDGAIAYVQPDLSKAGGLTETLRIAAMASAFKLPLCPHTSATGINMAANIHLLAALDNPGYFEADEARHNPFRNVLCSPPYALAADGTVRPLEAPGIGVEVDEAFIEAHPLIDGPGYVK